MLNVTKDVLHRNVHNACRLDIPWLMPEHCNFSGECAIVAGAPSIKNKIEELKNLNVVKFSVNGTHDFLVENGISPDFFVMLDARPCNDFAKKPQKNCVYFIASQCHPKVFQRLDNHNIILWHTEHELLPKKHIELKNKHHFGYISAKGSVGLTTIGLAYTLGFRTFHLYGFDSSFEDKQHPYKQQQNDADKIVTYEIHGKEYKSTPTLMAQIGTFIETEKLLESHGCNIIMRSEGLIKEIYEQLQRDRKANY